MIDWAGNSGISFFSRLLYYPHSSVGFPVACRTIFEHILLLLFPFFFLLPFHTRLVGDCVCILFSFIFRFKCFIIFTFTKRDRELVTFHMTFFLLFLFKLQTSIALFVWSSELSPHILFQFYIQYTYVHTYDNEYGTLQIVHYLWIWIDLNSFRWTSNERCTIYLTRSSRLKLVYLFFRRCCTLISGFITQQL